MRPPSPRETADLKSAEIVGYMHNIIIIPYVNKSDDKNFSKKQDREKCIFEAYKRMQGDSCFAKTIAAQGVADLQKRYVEKMTNFFAISKKGLEKT